jgi:hypothetical protein
MFQSRMFQSRVFQSRVFQSRDRKEADISVFAAELYPPFLSAIVSQSVRTRCVPLSHHRWLA